ncbi:MAG: riboflavin synthase subunit alpha [Pseudomonadales bacterium]|nr:riboflavin synthase subunit alpha [Pseudomonadales bacterium]
MFTGIVQGLCEVTRVEDHPSLRRLTLALGALAEGLDTGASVAVNGCCLTVTGCSGGAVTFDIIQESLALTNLGRLTEGSKVDVERSFRVGDEIGGHILSGHVAGCAEVIAVNAAENRRDISLRIPSRWMKYLHHKGFVALDGASLTITSVDSAKDTISVSLIPETIARTTLGSAVVGDQINLEIDAQTQAVVDTVERMLASSDWQARLHLPTAQ